MRLFTLNKMLVSVALAAVVMFGSALPSQAQGAYCDPRTPGMAPSQVRLCTDILQHESQINQMKARFEQGMQNQAGAPQRPPQQPGFQRPTPQVVGRVCDPQQFQGRPQAAACHRANQMAEQCAALPPNSPQAKRCESGVVNFLRQNQIRIN